ncbi:uncharacterized protein LOC125902837 [Epinephelus fuscoguttatus]|uniref:uncharacterized protein LOC125902837 n=1 Tax=Epinephelus fuscoguttatus TaxID=293821 RepID=UPI0020D081BE|nr:uncharacterized protein LOC125902837 [Epinephelus fuscoguttatus]XP_049455428.1 uncharacterized protein LOC125902837 [Epinephelus fuscoguttatus]
MSNASNCEDKDDEEENEKLPTTTLLGPAIQANNEDLSDSEGDMLDAARSEDENDVDNEDLECNASGENTSQLSVSFQTPLQAVVRVVFWGRRSGPGSTSPATIRPRLHQSSCHLAQASPAQLPSGPGSTSPAATWLRLHQPSYHQAQDSPAQLPPGPGFTSPTTIRPRLHQPSHAATISRLPSPVTIRPRLHQPSPAATRSRLHQPCCNQA